MTSQWAPSRWRLKSPASPLFTQPFIRARIKENIKAPRHLPLCGEFTGDRWIPRTNCQLRGKYFHLMTASCSILGNNGALMRTCEFSLLSAWTKWGTSRNADDLRPYDAHVTLCLWLFHLGMRTVVKGLRMAAYTCIVNIRISILFGIAAVWGIALPISHDKFSIKNIFTHTHLYCVVYNPDYFTTDTSCLLRFKKVTAVMFMPNTEILGWVLYGMTIVCTWTVTQGMLVSSRFYQMLELLSYWYL